MDALKKFKGIIKTASVKEIDNNPLSKNIRRLDSTAATKRIACAPRNRRPPTRVPRKEAIEEPVEEVAQPVVIDLDTVVQENQEVQITATEAITDKVITPVVENKEEETTESKPKEDLVQNEKVGIPKEENINENTESVKKTNDEIICMDVLKKPSMHRSQLSDVSDVSSCAEIVAIATPDIFSSSSLLNVNDNDLNLSTSEDEGMERQVFITSPQNTDRKPSRTEVNRIKNIYENNSAKVEDSTEKTKESNNQDVDSGVCDKGDSRKTSVSKSKEEPKTSDVSVPGTAEKKLSCKSKSVDVDSKIIATSVQLNNRSTSVDQKESESVTQNASVIKEVDTEEKPGHTTPVVERNCDVIVEN